MSWNSRLSLEELRNLQPFQRLWLGVVGVGTGLWLLSNGPFFLRYPTELGQTIQSYLNNSLLIVLFLLGIRSRIFLAKKQEIGFLLSLAIMAMIPFFGLVTQKESAFGSLALIFSFILFRGLFQESLNIAPVVSGFFLKVIGMVLLVSEFGRFLSGSVPLLHPEVGLELLMMNPLFGSGMQGFERGQVISFFTSSTANELFLWGGLRLLAEWGIVGFLLLLALVFSVGAFRQKLQRQLHTFLLLGVVFLPNPYLWLTLLLMSPRPQDEVIRLRLFGTGAIFLGLFIHLYLFIVPQVWLHHRDIPAPLPYWTVPLKEKEFAYRSNLASRNAPATQEEVQQHRALLEAWLAAAPNDEMALIQSSRWAYRTYPLKDSLEIALKNYSANPLSPVLARWVVRIHEELGEPTLALEFLRRHFEQTQTRHPLLMNRYQQLLEETKTP
ncbi:MAG: hypothetical protein SFY68_03440 [Candidatus Sumerlaeia bacterium]|nr:hypothetical protein [Candidatus Sumerlaeia bacterium]